MKATNNFSTTGLSPAQISASRAEHGANVLEVKKPESAWRKFARQFADLLVIVLLVAAGLSFAFGEFTDGLVIFIIVIVNAAIGFFQEFKTEKMLEALQKLVALNSKVLRGGKIQMIPASEVVVGDVLLLEEGVKIPADARLFAIDEIKIDEAILTGESVAVHKFLDKKDSRAAQIFSGTTVVAGSGRAIVTAVGRSTEFGKIAKLATTTEKSASPLTKEMQNIGVFVGKISLVISAILFLIGVFLQGSTFVEALLFAVAVAVAAVPEGLPVTITTALALGMRRLADKKALVRELKSVETLGATTVICSDKTGTLTRNEMVVRRGWLADHGEFEVSGSGYDPRSGSVSIVRKNLDAQKLFAIMDAVNDAELAKNGRTWKILGDPTEAALRVAAKKFGISQKFRRAKTFPFDSNRKLMSALIGSEIWAKGAPEQLLARCTHFFEKGKIKKLDAKTRKRILQHAEFFANDALRVLGAAFRPVKKGEKLTPEKAEAKLIFVGLLGMYDSPRREVPEAVEACRAAGIRITIVTGDFGETARAIARELGIADAKTKVIVGDALRKMSDRELQKILRRKENLIFARVKPDDKLRIVENYKKLGEIVAVTGDGVNDAPALKRADIGVAMGRCGADVAKEAASLILTDDSFATIVDAISEGRRIYGNMKKFIGYIFSCNIGELVVVVVSILLGLPLPLTAVLILLVDLGTDLLPTLALGIDPADPLAMNAPPRNPNSRILQGKFIWHFLWMGVVIGALVLGSYFGILLRDGWQFGVPLSAQDSIHIRASSFAFAALVVIQLFNIFNFRSEILSAFSRRIQKNLFIWFSVVSSAALVLFVVQVPWSHKIFDTASLSLFEWFTVVAVSATIFFIEEIRKMFVRLLKFAK
ncbi:MAG: cation-transporting P-type ATPase [Patescibacteria group bacterium]